MTVDALYEVYDARLRFTARQRQVICAYFSQITVLFVLLSVCLFHLVFYSI